MAARKRVAREKQTDRTDSAPTIFCQPEYDPGRDRLIE